LQVLAEKHGFDKEQIFAGQLFFIFNQLNNVDSAVQGDADDGESDDDDDEVEISEVCWKNIEKLVRKIKQQWPHVMGYCLDANLPSTKDMQKMFDLLHMRSLQLIDPGADALRTTSTGDNTAHAQHHKLQKLRWLWDTYRLTHDPDRLSVGDWREFAATTTVDHLGASLRRGDITTASFFPPFLPSFQPSLLP
jgi:hypothetical protein